jgi:putative effector of murein hydrolase
MTRRSANYKTRLVVAFCVAPLVVPVSVFISFRDDLLWALNLALAGVILAYVGTALFGIPVYRFLHARRWVFLWTATFAGFISGMITWYLFSRLISLDPGLFGVRAFWIWPGVWGAIVGASMWLIARPDRNLGA